jgi:methylene-fatty-acyl-phospholipid synthase
LLALTDAWVFSAAAMALALERACYAWICQRPDAFRAVARSARGALDTDPTQWVLALFCAFKLIQLAVVAGWCLHFGAITGWPDNRGTAAGVVGAALLLCGQTLNLSVFLRLGRVGVFYGDRLGHSPPWRDGFPFSLFEHPQYVGAVLSIWGLFAIARFPHNDWFALPVLETVYYTVGARLERAPRARASACEP